MGRVNEPNEFEDNIASDLQKSMHFALKNFNQSFEAYLEFYNGIDKTIWFTL